LKGQKRMTTLPPIPSVNVLCCQKACRHQKTSQRPYLRHSFATHLIEAGQVSTMSRCFWATDRPPRPPSTCMSVGSTWLKSSVPRQNTPTDFVTLKADATPRGLEVAEIFRHTALLIETPSVAPQSVAVMRAIEVCRTASWGVIRPV